MDLRRLIDLALQAHKRDALRKEAARERANDLVFELVTEEWNPERELAELLADEESEA